MKITKMAKEKFSDRKIRYEVVCTKCGRKKIMTRQRIVNGVGTSHKSCSYSIGEYSKRFNDIWRGIRDRTTNPNCSVYYNYGAKGIKSDAFKYFADFYDSMYLSYCKAIERYGDEKIISIDRISVYGDYTPENCRWISLDKQKGNRRNNHWFKAKSPEHDLFIEQNLSRFQRSFGVDRHKIAECLRGDRDSYHGWTFAFLNAEETKRVNKDISLHYGNVYIGKSSTITIFNCKGENFMIEIRTKENLSNKQREKIYDAVKKNNHNSLNDIGSIEFSVENGNGKIIYHKNDKGSNMKFERIRRITGYLTGDVNGWNDAKRAELDDRVKHA